MRIFERNIFVIETFALSPLIPELYWFSWESLWSIFWLWSMVLLAYLLDDSLMWADFQVYIKDASFREEHFCNWKFRSISSHSWVVLILVRKPLEYFLIMIHGPSSLFIGRLVDVSWFSSLTLLAKQLYRLSTVEQYIVKLAIRYYVFSSCKCM